MYTFYWFSGRKEILEGDSPDDALNKAGYGLGVLRALDFFEPGCSGEWVWDSSDKRWVKNLIL